MIPPKQVCHPYYHVIPPRQVFQPGRARGVYSPPSEGKKQFCPRFLAIIVPQKPYFSLPVETVSPPSEDSWRHPCLEHRPAYGLAYISCAQLGIVLGRGPVHEKGTLKLFKDDTTFDYCLVEIVWEVYWYCYF